MLHDGLEERRHVAAAQGRIQRGNAVKRGGVDHGKIELRIAGPQTVEEIERLVEHPAGARASAVDLVDDDDRMQTAGERLLGDEARLRHRPLDGVDQQQHRIDHRQHALDFAAEVGVTGRVNDVDPEATPLDGGVFGENGDTALALEVVCVHDAFDLTEALAERARLLQQPIDEGGLAMVDMRDDGDVA